MEEIVTIDGKQYKLSYDQHITTEQRLQAIEDIRRSSEHNMHSQVEQLDNNVRKIGTLSAGMRIS